jgi:molecular chaperone HtpG
MTQKLPFKTELKQILDIIIHSLYSHKDIFLRELISNASDAIDTLRFQSLTRGELLEGGDSNWKIKLSADETNGTLTVSDNGIGMSPETIVENLGTIARSGTKAFLESLKSADVQSRPELIGQFGVGFYSAFMVADRVTVVSRLAGDAPQNGVRWESDGQGEFSVETVEKPTRGTDVILHLREEDREFLKEWQLRQLVKHYSDFVEHPVVMDIVREDEKKEKQVTEETLNARKAIWLRPKSEVKREDYVEFYKHLTHDFEEPAEIVHYAAEGLIEFKALLYLPAHRTYEVLFDQGKKGIHLYIRRVFITADSDMLLPHYLHFVSGVVDSPDLPLNVSREMLQHSPALEKIRSNLVNKILRTLQDMKQSEYDKYVAFYKELGMLLKEGVYQDWSNREQIAGLLLYESTRTEPGKFTDLEKYVAAMPADQQEIYYLLGDNRELLEHSPYLEAFKSRGQEVLLLTDAIDEFVVQALTEYKGKKLKAVDRGDLAGAEVDAEKKKQFQALLDYIKQKLDEVKEVRLSSRLQESAACLVSDEWAMGRHMEEMLRRMGRGGEVPPSKKILELNPNHPAVMAVQKLHARDAADTRLDDYCRLLYDEAVIAEGARVKDPAAFVRRINGLLAKDAAS